MSTEDRKAQYRASYYRNQARYKEAARLRQAKKRSENQETPEQAEARRVYNRARYAERYGPEAKTSREQEAKEEEAKWRDRWTHDPMFRSIVIAILADRWKKTYAYRQQWKRDHYVPKPRPIKPPPAPKEEKAPKPIQTNEERLEKRRAYEKKRWVDAAKDPEKLEAIRKQRRDAGRRWIGKMRTYDPKKYAEYVKRQTEREMAYRMQSPQRKIAQLLRTSMYQALKKQTGARKSLRMLELAGCDRHELVAHIESQFEPGMTWDKLGRGEGKFAIDHIRPCASFDLTDEAQQKQAFHWTNLRPMWWLDNQRKSSHWNGRKWFHTDHACKAAGSGNSG